MSSRARVLLVDDDPALLDALPAAIRLRMPNIDVEICDSAFEALGRIRDVAFDAIVTDIKMPGMDGCRYSPRCKSGNRTRRHC